MKKILGILLSVLMIVTCVCINTNMKVYADTPTNWNRFYGDSADITLDDDSLSEDDALSFINSKLYGNDQYDGYFVVYAKSGDNYSYLRISYDENTNKYYKGSRGEYTYDELKSNTQVYHIYVIGIVTTNHNSGMIEPQGFTITRYDTYYKISGLTIPSGKHLVVAAVKNSTINNNFSGVASTCYQYLLSVYDLILHNSPEAFTGFNVGAFECHVLSSVEDKIEFSDDCNPDAGIYVSIASDFVENYKIYPAYTLGMTINPAEVGTSSDNKLQPELTESPSTPTTPTGGSNATGDSSGNTYKVVNTGVEGVNTNNSLSKVVSLFSLVTLAGYVVIKKKED